MLVSKSSVGTAPAILMTGELLVCASLTGAIKKSCHGLWYSMEYTGVGNQKVYATYIDVNKGSHLVRDHSNQKRKKKKKEKHVLNNGVPLWIVTEEVANVVLSTPSSTINAQAAMHHL